MNGWTTEVSVNQSTVSEHTATPGSRPPEQIFGSAVLTFFSSLITRRKRSAWPTCKQKCLSLHCHNWVGQGENTFYTQTCSQSIQSNAEIFIALHCSFSRACVTWSQYVRKKTVAFSTYKCRTRFGSECFFFCILLCGWRRSVEETTCIL